MRGETRVTGGSFRRQLVVLSATVTAVAAVVLALLVQLVLSQTSSRSVGRVLTERSASVVAAADSASPGVRVVVPDPDLGAGVAVYDPGGRLVAGAAPSDLSAVYAELVDDVRSEPGVRSREANEDTQVRAAAFTLSSGVGGIVVVSERIGPYEAAERYAFVVSIATGLLAVLASAALAAWVSRRALAPVVEMAATARAWSERDLARRFDLGAPGNEITALAATLDGLLDTVSAAILSEQRLTAELAHELRTPLTAVQGTADLLALRPDLDPAVRVEVEQIRDGTRRMAETVTGLLELARSTSTRGGTAASRLSTTLARIAQPHPSVVVTGVGDDLVALPEALVTRAVAPVVDNAVRVATRVTISVVAARSGFVAVAVDDDGPGIAADDSERVFEAGYTRGPHAGSGLGLPLARRIARSAGGDVRHEPLPVGSRFVVELPRG